MQLTKLKPIVLTVILAVCQLTINSVTPLYLDVLGVLLVVMLIENGLNGGLIALSFIADFIGHWYLGSHLIALIIISFLRDYLVNFYRISNYFQKNILLMLFYTSFSVLLLIIDVLLHNVHLDKISYLLEIIVLCPAISAIVSKYFTQEAKDIIY